MSNLFSVFVFVTDVVDNAIEQTVLRVSNRAHRLLIVAPLNDVTKDWAVHPTLRDNEASFVLFEEDTTQLDDVTSLITSMLLSTRFRGSFDDLAAWAHAAGMNIAIDSVVGPRCLIV